MTLDMLDVLFIVRVTLDMLDVLFIVNVTLSKLNVPFIVDITLGKLNIQFIVDMTLDMLDALITLPSGVTELGSIIQTSPNTFSIKYIASESGRHQVTVLNNNQPIKGSPFFITVGSITDGVYI